MTAPLTVHGGLLDGIENALSQLGAHVSDVVVALAVLGIGLFVAGKLQDVAVRLGRRTQFEEIVDETPFGALFSDDVDGASRAFGAVVRLYVVLVALFGAFTYVGAFGQLAGYLREAVTYVPIFVGGLLVLILGLYLADSIAESVGDSATAQTVGFPDVFEEVTKALLYFVVLVIGLDTIGVSVGILYTFGETFALAAGLALALAVGIAFGWGGKDYVAENIGQWHAGSAEPRTSADD